MMLYNNFMKKFRVISDLHLDINSSSPIGFDDDVFTLICGDTSGDPSLSINWIKSNIKNGLVISGNHLPYNSKNLTMQELRSELETAFPKDGPITYLDAECQTFFKEVDGILFVGTCMYSDMRISTRYNPDGQKELNMHKAARSMNDYHFGIISKTHPFGADNYPHYQHMTPADYVKWFGNAFVKIDKLLTENEAKEKPLPVVLLTHFPLIKDILSHSYYVDPDNYASYGSDRCDWLLSHPSIKCYCCGHAHMVDKNFKNYLLPRDDGTAIRVVSNTRGYLHSWHDKEFNKNTFVNTDDWTVTVEPETEEEAKAKQERYKSFEELMKLSSAFIC